jgi:hypothetical protein
MARASANDSPENWFGTRTVIRMEMLCGWCLTQDCENCQHELGYYEKLWICGCKCNTSWEPKAVTVERKEQVETTKKRTTSPRAKKQETDAVGTRSEVPEGTTEESGTTEGVAETSS